MFRQTKRKPKITATRRSRVDDDDDDDHDNEGNDNATSSVLNDNLTRSKKREQQDKGKEDEEVKGKKEQQEEEEEEESPFVIRKHQEKKRNKKKIKRPLSRDGDDDNDGDHDETQENSKSKKRRRGLTIAPTTSLKTTLVIDDEAENDFGPLQQQEDEPHGDYIAPTYGKEALEALKAEQKRIQRTVQEDPPMEENSGSPPTDAPVVHRDEKAAETSMNQDFISFHDMGETTEHDFMGDDDPVMPQPLDHENLGENDDDDNQWEEQIARRAGVPPSTDTKSQSRAAVVTPSLDMLRDTLQGTIQHLITSEENLGHAIMRREADLAQTTSDAKRQQESIHEAGMACSDYQELRYQLATWVGALRDLEEKVLPIQKSLLDMVLLQFEVAHQEWRHWQDDVGATLQEFHRLDRVLGWVSPNLTTPEGDAQQQQQQLDEFGRDIGSLVRRDRDNRFRRRRQKEVTIGKMEKDDDAILHYLWSQDEGSSRRFEILQEALRVAMDDLDDDYTSPQRLVNCFENWKRKYPDEYKKCYANLSLADLAHVFDQVELCRATWVRACLKENQDLLLEGTLFPTTINMPPPNDDNDGDSEGTFKLAWEKAYRKEFIPFLLEISRASPSIIFLSKRMSRFFCHSLQEIIQKVGHDSPSAQELRNAFATAGVTVLQALSIPVATLKVGDNEPFHDRLEDALRFTKTWLPQWIQNLLLHLLEYWIPIVDATRATTTIRLSIETREPLTHATLSFLSETYLYFLSSLSSPQAATEHFSPIWNCLCRNYRPLLESPELILQCAPLRAAASAYGLQTLW